jgi:hypothetical protein
MSSLSEWILFGLGLYIAFNYKLYLRAFRLLRDRGAKPSSTYGHATAKEIAAVTGVILGWPEDKVSRFLSSYSTEIEGLESASSKEDLINKMELLFKTFVLSEEGAK